MEEGGTHFASPDLQGCANPRYKAEMLWKRCDTVLVGQALEAILPSVVGSSYRGIMNPRAHGGAVPGGNASTTAGRTPTTPQTSGVIATVLSMAVTSVSLLTSTNAPFHPFSLITLRMFVTLT